MGTRRDRGRRVAGLAAPGIALALSAVVLSGSRSADAVTVVVVALWLAVVPVRLRSVVVLAVGGAGAAVISGWALSHSVLTADRALTPAADAAGHTFGAVAAITLVVVTVVSVACTWAMDHRPVAAGTRRRVGTALVVLACLLPVAAVGAVAASSRGLTGEISHAWTTLTSTHSVATNAPTRVLQFGSSRPLYWHQGLDVGTHAMLKGVGASGYGIARLRYTTDPAKSDQAHSYIIETFADLGLIGVAITLALLAAWVRAALRPLAVRTGWEALAGAAGAEREGMVALALIVLGFGIQSTLDWTWYFPGVAVPALLCAGWLAGRGPLTEPVGWVRVRRSPLDRPGAVAGALLVVTIALAGAWMQWQPQRSADQLNAALDASSNAEAFADARAAASSDPLSNEPRFFLAALDQSANDIPAARAELTAVVRRQPENPVTWLHLGQLQAQTGQLRQAIATMTRVGYLDHVHDNTFNAAVAVITAAQAKLARAGVSARPQRPVSSPRRSPGRGRAARTAARRAAGARTPQRAAARSGR